MQQHTACHFCRWPAITPEEEAAQLRRQIDDRRARMRRRTLRRRAILSCLSESHDQSSSQLYTQLNTTVPILAVFFSGGDLKPGFRLSRESFNRLLALLPPAKRPWMEP
ncbi:hypothetical protein N1851_006666 [Merluccius polli]|uniref:Uncharacterized protein n=1 Tax=Merluccius polli TaxID=89951 RepID=A0AA47N5H5_MERPO|nr:hypothetical protein N1851_006666 [Merluccius polli]